MPSNRPSTYNMRVTSRSTLATQARQDEALALREANFAYSRIATRLGYAAAQGAAEACRAARARRANANVGSAIGSVAPTVSAPVASSFPSTRTFGVEFEFKGLSASATMTALTNAGISLYSQVGYTHTVMATWKIVTDGSVNGGYELVSPILRGQDGIDEAARAIKALQQAGAYIDRQCGLHVHVGMDNLNGAQMMSIMDLYIANQANINTIIAPSRHDTFYCKPNSRATQDQLRHYSAIRQSSNKTDVVRAAKDSDRYYAVNLQSYAKYGTMEFRQHQGTLNGKKAGAWVKFVLAMVEAGSTGVTTRFGSFSDTLDGVGNLDSETKTYLLGRETRLARR